MIHMKKTKVKSLFLSDIHLGSGWCKAEQLTDLLGKYKFDNLFLIGDILDLYPKKLNLTAVEVNLIHKVLKLSKKGVNVVWVLGNHDDKLHSLLNYTDNILGIKLCREHVYTSECGNEILLTHGDLVDLPLVRRIYHLGDFCYTAALTINHWVNIFRKLVGLDYFSLSQKLKDSVKDVVKFIGDYEHRIVEYTKYRGFTVVVAGHIHKAGIKDIDGVTYMNCGDWVESCTGIVEGLDGEFYVIG